MQTHTLKITHELNKKITIIMMYQNVRMLAFHGLKRASLYYFLRFYLFI